MKKNLKKYLLLGLIVFIFLGTIGTVYAYWAASVAGAKKDTTETITVGEAEPVTTIVDFSKEQVPTSGNLVPEGQVENSGAGAVDEVTLTYQVDWKEDETALATGHSGTLAVEVTEVAIDENTTLGASYVRIETTPLNSAIILDGAAITVVVKVKLLEPETHADYVAIAGKNITFKITFTVTA